MSCLHIPVLFGVALLPRVLSLAAFVTPDERRWLSRSADLLKALLTGDLSLTYHEGNPAGIVTKWCGMVGLWGRYALHKLGWRAHLDPELSASRDLWSFLDAVQDQPQNILDVLPAARLPVAFISAALIVAMYLLLRRLWGERVALVAAFLIALDPFFLAHSRVLHQDALVTGFTVLCVLALAAALQEAVDWRLIAASGALAALAALTKPTALVLLAWAGGWVLVWGVRKRILPRGLPLPAAAGLLWLAALAAVYFLLWPAMWTDPVDTLTRMWERSAELAVEGHEQFFFGHVTDDPGPLFYPVVLLFRTTPTVWVGLAALAYHSLRRAAAVKGKGWPILFILLFLVVVTLSAKKQDRYLLPVFPLLDVLAAMGWVEILNGLRLKDARTGGGQAASVSRLAMGLGLLVVVQGGLTLWHHPYYLTYYNLLAGGPWTAPRVLLIGWGEGLDEAGRYLSRKPEADELSVASYYRRELSPFFPGEVRKVADSQPDDFDLIAWHASDYVVCYISQMQRNQPDAATVRYLRSLEPEHVVRVGGIEYAWVYRTPEFLPDELIPAARVDRRNFGGLILLLGYDLRVINSVERPFLTVSLYWQGLARMEQDYEVHLAVVDRGGAVWGSERLHPYHNQYRTSLWPRGLVLRDVHEVALAEDAPPGDYFVTVRLVDAESGRELRAEGGEVRFGPVSLGGG